MNDRITINPDILIGKPVIKGTRLSVEFIVGLLAQGWNMDDILKEYDHISREDVQACLAYAHQLLVAVDQPSADDGIGALATLRKIRESLRAKGVRVTREQIRAWKQQGRH